MINISKAMSVCHKNKIKVYPVISGNFFRVAVSVKGTIKVFDKEVHKKEINEALTKTYLHYYKKIVSK